MAVGHLIKRFGEKKKMLSRAGAEPGQYRAKSGRARPEGNGWMGMGWGGGGGGGGRGGGRGRAGAGGGGSRSSPPTPTTDDADDLLSTKFLIL